GIAQFREKNDFVFRLALDSHFMQRLFGMTCKDCHPEYQWAYYFLTFCRFVHPLDNSFHHFRAARRMNIKDAHTQPRRFDSRFPYSTGYVVELQIKENMSAERYDFAHGIRTGGSKELFADLKHSGKTAQSLDKTKCLLRRINIEGDYDRIADGNSHLEFI